MASVLTDIWFPSEVVFHFKCSFIFLFFLFTATWVTSAVTFLLHCKANLVRVCVDWSWVLNTCEGTLKQHSECSVVNFIT